jgi:hypothetical protein
MAEIDVVFDFVFWEEMFPSNSAYVQFGRVAGCSRTAVACDAASIDEPTSFSETEEDECDEEMDSDEEETNGGEVAQSAPPRICFLAGTLFLQER